MITVFSITAYATDDDLVGSVPDDTSSGNTSVGDGNNTSSDNNSSSSNSSSSSNQSSSSDQTSSEDTTQSKPETTVKTTLQIVELPKKLVYEVGEKLDLTGLKVNIISAEGVIISQDGKDLNVSITTLSKEGKQKVEIKVNDAKAQFEVTVNPKHAHSYGAWEIEKEATCAQEGSKVRVCECKHKETQVIEKLPHDWDEGKIIKNATQKTAGVIRYSCTNCDEVMDETIPILGDGEQTGTGINAKFKLQMKWWMIFVPVGVILAGYALAIAVIFKKKS